MPPSTSRRRKTLLILALTVGMILVSLGGIIGFLPMILKSQLPGLLRQATGQPASVENIALGVMPLSVRVTNLALGTEQRQPIIALTDLYLAIDALESVSRRALVIEQLTLAKPVVQLSKNKDGKLNVSDLLAPSKADKPSSGKPLLVTIANLSLQEGKLVYRDTVRPHLTTTLFPLELTLRGFNSDGGKPADVELSLHLDSGASAHWQGRINLAPVQFEGNIKLAGVDLKKALALAGVDFLTGQADAELTYQAGYGQQGLNLTVQKAKLSFKDLHYQQPGLSLQLAGLEHETELALSHANGQLRITAKAAKTTGRQLTVHQPVAAAANNLMLDSPYQLSYSGQGLDLIVKQGDAAAAELKLLPQAGQSPLLSLARLTAQNIRFDLAGKRLELGDVGLDNANSQAVLNADGKLNYQQLLASKPGTANEAESEVPAATATGGKTWQIAAQTINLTNSAISFTDQSLTSPVTVNFKPVNLSLTGFDNQQTRPLPVTLAAGVNGNGAIQLNGEFGWSPLTAKLNVAVNNLDLEKMAGYFSQYVRLNLIDGAANLTGDLNLNAQQPLALTFQGDLNIVNLLTRDQRVYKDFVKWAKLSLDGITLDTSTNRYTARRLALDKPYARVTIRKDKSVNFDNLLISQRQPNTPQKLAPAQKQQPRYFKVDKISVAGGSSDFTDLSLILPFSAYIQDLQGGADGVSSATDSKIKLSLSGNAYELAPVNIEGNLSPYRGDYDIQLDFQGLPMPLVSPYMVQFAGYKIEKGKMSLTLNYQVKDKKLTANNKLLIDQFELGEQVPNPDAVTLPLKLAVALLKDSTGRIKFDIPIEGSLENPQFSISALIAEALSNALGKIIRSPFSLLASLVDGGDDLSAINFSPGHVDLAQPELDKLNKLAAALTERPGLTVGIKGVAYQRQDWPDIRDDALYDQLKQRRADEINKTSEVKIRSEYVTLSDDEYRKLLADLFIEKFPSLAERSLLGTPKLKNGQGGDFYQVAKQKLQEILNPEPQRLKELAISRARAIAKYLVKHGKVAQSQIFILDPLVDQEQNAKEVASLLSVKAD